MLNVAWISSDYFDSLLLPQLLRGENDSKQSDEFQAMPNEQWIFWENFSAFGQIENLWVD